MCIRFSGELESPVGSAMNLESDSLTTFMVQKVIPARVTHKPAYKTFDFWTFFLTPELIPLGGAIRRPCGFN